MGSVRIAVDAMGGDDAPQAPVEGAVRAAREDGVDILLVGRKPEVEARLEALGFSGSNLEVVHAEEVVGMDEPAITPLRRKRNSSVGVCAELVKAGRAQGMVSAGNTGAVMAVAKRHIGTILGVERPALAAVFPNASGRTVVLDVGANVDTKAEQLRQFAVMGHFYASEVLGTSTPRVGLVSIGEERGKGTSLTREVYEILQQSGLNFIGNIEGRDFFDGTVDVVVCDGFVGNVVLKSSEALAAMLAEILREEVRQDLRTRLGAWLLLPALRRLRQRTDPDEYGAAPLLGLEAAVLIGHGSSSPRAVQSSIQRAREFAAARLPEKIRGGMERMHAEERRFLDRAEPSAGETGEQVS